jgi:signal transduction histidine kinase
VALRRRPEARFGVVPEEDSAIVSADEANCRPFLYLGAGMSRFLADYGRRYIFDVLIVAAALGAALELVFTDDPEAPDASLWVAIPIPVLLTLSLLARRRFPFGVPVGIFLVSIAISFIDVQLVIFTFAFFLTAIACAFLLGMLENEVQSRIGLVIAIGAIAILVWNDPVGAWSDFFFISLFFVIAWLAGLGLGGKLQEAAAAREHMLRLEREREDQARRAVADERARIARELHDVVGHSVSVMTVQASAVRRLLRDDQIKEREALTVVEETGRQALAEMRRLVGVLRRPEEAPALAPQPSLEHLDKLVAQVRDAGLPVELRIEGKPAQLSPGVDLTAYRLVQEGLTNALKHANAHQAEVVVSYGAGEVVLQVTDDGTGDETDPSGGDGSGQGLMGLRERVSVYGGVIESGPGTDGGFTLRARLPLG